MSDSITLQSLCAVFHKVNSLYKVWLCNSNNSQAKPVNMWYHTQMHTQAKNNADVQPQYWCVYLYLSIEALSWLNLGMVKNNKTAMTRSEIYYILMQTFIYILNANDIYFYKASVKWKNIDVNIIFFILQNTKTFFSTFAALCFIIPVQ